MVDHNMSCHFKNCNYNEGRSNDLGIHCAKCPSNDFKESNNEDKYLVVKIKT